MRNMGSVGHIKKKLDEKKLFSEPEYINKHHHEWRMTFTDYGTPTYAYCIWCKKIEKTENISD